METQLISSSLIGLRDNASWEFPARVEIFQLAEDAIEANFTRSQHSRHLIQVIRIFVLTLYVIYSRK